MYQCLLLQAPEAGFTDDCKPTTVMLQTELWSSTTTVHALDQRALSNF